VTQIARAVHLLTLLLWSSGALLPNDKENFFGTILAVRGEAYVARGFMEFDVKMEDRLQYEDEIETGEDGQVQLSFKSSFLSIGPNTCFTISNEVEDDLEITLIDLESGEVRSRILDMAGNERYRVESMNGSVEVTGTDFVSGVNPDNDAFSVSVLHGSVKVSQDAGSPQAVTTMEALSELGTSSSKSSSLTEKDASGIRQRLPLPGDKEARVVPPTVATMFDGMPPAFSAMAKPKVSTGSEVAQTIQQISLPVVNQVDNTNDTKEQIATQQVARRLARPLYLPPQ
jgi:hypothetical protein